MPVVPPTGVVLTPKQVAGYAYIGGFRGNEIVQAVQVAYAESSWRTDASNSCCVGLWQINLKQHNVSRGDMVDPTKNAAQAYKIYKAAGGWCATGSPANHNCNPWQGYGNSAYNRVAGQAASGYAAFMKDIQAGKKPEEILGIGAAGITQTVNDLTGIGGIVGAFNRMGSWITNPDNLMRIFKVIAGGAVILVGGAALMDKEIVSVATSVIPAGKVAKVLK